MPQNGDLKSTLAKKILTVVKESHQRIQTYNTRTASRTKERPAGERKAT